jgi:multiple sugar transport system ATP-binding protein
MSALTVRDLRVNFGPVAVLKGIDLSIDSGEFVVLVGPSGCGKSTLLNVVAGLQSSSAGHIEIGGRDVTHVAPKDRDIAMVFQSYALYPSMTVRGNITFGMECRGVGKAQRNEAVERVAKLLQIGPLLDRRPSQLSGGQRQRVAMGRALVRDPILFLFDEPLSNLDAKLRVEMRMEIKRLHQRVGTTMVYVTHDQIEAMTLATRIAVMREGEIQQFDDPQTVYDAPTNLFVARFMGSPPMNTIPVRVESDGDGVVVEVRQPDGSREILRMPRSRESLAAWVGRDALLGLRPECISLQQGNDRAGGDNLANLHAQVEMIEPTGAETMALVSLAGVEAMAKLKADARPAAGSRAAFTVDMSKACLFDPETELRIR